MKFQSLIPLIFAFCTPVCHSAWDYSIEYKIAIAEASFDACKKIDRNIASKGRIRTDEYLNQIGNDKITEVKATDEYKSTYQDALQSFTSLIKKQKGSAQKKKACKAIMGVDGYHL